MLPQTYLRTLTGWRTVFHLFNSLCSQWNYGISAVQFSLFTGFMWEYLNPGVKMSASPPCLSVCLWCTETLVSSVRLNWVHRLNILVRRQTLYLRLTGDLNRSSEPLLLLNERIVLSGSSGFRLISVRTGASGVDICTSLQQETSHCTLHTPAVTSPHLPL